MLRRVRIPLSHIRVRQRVRPEGYYTEVISSGKVIEDRFLEIDNDTFYKLESKYLDLPAKIIQAATPCC